MEKIIIFIYVFVLLLLGIKQTNPMMFNYTLAGFGWWLYIVGRLFFDRKKYDKDDNGLGWEEVKAYLKMNWIAFLFNGMLLIIIVPYTEILWYWGIGFFEISKDWIFNDLAYVLAGSFILVVQIIIDIVRWKLRKLKDV